MTADQATARTDGDATPADESEAPPRLSGPQTITNELIDAVATSGCGWSRRQIELLGAPWPLVAGWREKLIGEGRTLSAREVEALYAARKAKRATEADPAEIPVLPCPWCSRPVPRTTQGGNLKEFCSKRCKVSFNNTLTTAAIEHARLLRTPGALKAWAEARVNPSPSGGDALPRTTGGTEQHHSPSAPARPDVA